MRISDFIHESNQMDSPQALLALMERAVGDLGFDRYAYCALTRHDRYKVGSSPAPAVALNYPTDWTDHYFENRYQDKDPVLLCAPLMEGPFLWEWLERLSHLDREQRIVMQQAREAGLVHGVGIPLHGPQGNVCLLTCAADSDHTDPLTALSDLGVLATQFHLAYGAMRRPAQDLLAVPRLSPRERVCLQWAASGKSSWEVGKILKIGECTVNYHLKNAFRKLNTNSRIAAVVNAIRLGLISL